MSLFYPIDEWQHELTKASKSGLIATIEHLAAVYEWQRESLLDLAKRAKAIGRVEDAHTRAMQYIADPKAAADRWARRRDAAKKAARKRKRARKVQR